MIIGYVRVSTREQDVSAQKHAIMERYEVEAWYEDQAESGMVKALERPQFRKMAEFVRAGDIVVVMAIDRLGRNTIDVLETVEFLKDKGVTVVSLREQFDLASPIGGVLLTVASAFAGLERAYIKERQMAGIRNARSQGKQLGRKPSINLAEVHQWRVVNQASIAATARHFNISVSTVKRAAKFNKEDVCRSER